MKVLVVLVLAVFTGCSASSKLDELTDAIQDSVVAVVSPVTDFFDRLQQTKFGQDLNAHLEQGVSVVESNYDAVRQALGQPLRDVEDYISTSALAMSMTLSEKQSTIEKNLEPVAEKLAPVAEKIAAVLTEKTQGVRDLASPYVNKLMEKLDSLSKDIPARLDTLYDNL